ncbi:MAG: (2Fe-2S)-binding protein [Burkholderiales bacterium]|nr:(2Fe-2S)-binding protein [Burkholderiales bacterium]
MKITLEVNGKAVTRECEPQTLLVEFIRETLHLTGTHVGCDTAQCGACTVILSTPETRQTESFPQGGTGSPGAAQRFPNGRAVKACNTLAAQAQGGRLTTIEGLAAADGTLHPMQAAFRACHGLQCGFCTPGMVMSAVDLVQHHACGTEQQIREGLDGNICRCTGYHNIVRAVQQGAAAMKA